MQKIKIDKIEETVKALRDIPYFPSKSALFFPIELNKEVKELDGISMLKATLSVNSGSNAMIKYGILVKENFLELAAALYNDEHALTLNVPDFCQVVNNTKKLTGKVGTLKGIDDLECRVLKDDAILFTVALI